jgi:hypothetical protein
MVDNPLKIYHVKISFSALPGAAFRVGFRAPVGVSHATGPSLLKMPFEKRDPSSGEGSGLVAVLLRSGAR